MVSNKTNPKTLFDKIWDTHIVHTAESGIDILYLDVHLIHDVTSPQAFNGLREKGNKVLRPGQTLATSDHNVPTKNQHLPIADVLSKQQVEALKKNCEEFGIEFYGLNHPFNGIVHVIGPELGLTLPGMTIVCGDSHTSTHGAFGSIAFGIGTSEIEQVLTTQCLLQLKPKQMLIQINGVLKKGVSGKDIVLYLLSKLSSNGGIGHFIEYKGSAIKDLSMEGRMTLCNMSIEMGARGGLIAPDETTFQYIKGRHFAPKGESLGKAEKHWKTLFTDQDAKFDKVYHFIAEDIEPMITFGTNPGMAIKLSGKIPSEREIESPDALLDFKKSLEYMDLRAGTSLIGQKIDYVFIGSCTNSRIEDLRVAAEFIKGKKKAKDVEVWIVPGSKQVEKQAREEGIDEIFKAAGFELRGPGCSACLGMNEDKIPKGKYCISTSNRNFEGRQGPGVRTFLSGPLLAAAAAISGKIVNVTELIK